MTPSDTAHPEGERELLPCPNPWCASKEPPEPTLASWRGGFRMTCKCGVQTPPWVTREQAETAWNTRPTPPSRPQGEEGLSEDDRSRLMTLVGSVASVDRTEEYRAFKERVFGALSNQGPSS